MFFTTIVYSQNFLIVDSLDRKLINLTFNEEYVEVMQICDSLISFDSKNPKYYFYYFGANALQLHEKINQSPLNGRDSLREFLVDQSIEKLENVIQDLDDVPMTPQNRFYIASLHGYYSRFAGLNRYWWSAYVNGTKANGLFEEIIEEFPECYDAYLYPGVFSYYAARLKGFTGFIANILGVSGDRTDGINYIKLALEKGKLVYPQALLMMLEINSIMEDNPNKSIPYFEKFIKEYPKNKRVINWYGHSLLNLKRTSKIDLLIKKDSNNVIDSFVKTKFYFLTGQLDSTIKHAEYSLQKGNTWKGIVEHTKYYYVYSNWILKKKIIKEKQKLNSFYSSLFQLDLKNDAISKYIYKLTTELAKENYSEFEKLIIINQDFKEKYFEAEFNLLMGIYYFKQNKLDESIPYFKKAYTSTDRRRKQIALRYQLDLYLNKTVSIKKVNNLIEQIENSKFNKLVFRLDDLKEKYYIP